MGRKGKGLRATISKGLRAHILETLGKEQNNYNVENGSGKSSGSAGQVQVAKSRAISNATITSSSSRTAAAAAAAATMEATMSSFK